MAKLTKPLIERSLPSDGRDLFLWDDAQPGFGVRIRSSGRRTYFCQYRNRHGTSRRYTLGVHGNITLDQARKLVRDLMFQVAQGKDPAAQRQAAREAPTVAELAEEYLQRHASKKRLSSQRNDTSLLRRHIVPELGSRKATEVKTVDLERLHARLAETPYQANRVLALASRIFSLAVDAQVCATNPCPGIKRFDEEHRERWLSEEELRRLFEALNEYPNQRSANVIRLMLLTGARRGEVLAARWEEFDFERGSWTKPSHHTKQRKTEHVPLSDAALQLLAVMRAQRRDEFLFPGNVSGHPLSEIKRAWASICRMAELENVRMHDLRHTFGSHLASSGSSLYIVGRLLGHTQSETTKRYAHLADTSLRDAANLFGSKLSSLISTDSGRAAEKE